MIHLPISTVLCDICYEHTINIDIDEDFDGEDLDMYVTDKLEYTKWEVEKDDIDLHICPKCYTHAEAMLEDQPILGEG